MEPEPFCGTEAKKTSEQLYSLDKLNHLKESLQSEDLNQKQNGLLAIRKWIKQPNEKSLRSFLEEQAIIELLMKFMIQSDHLCLRTNAISIVSFIHFNQYLPSFFFPTFLSAIFLLLSSDQEVVFFDAINVLRKIHANSKQRFNKQCQQIMNSSLIKVLQSSLYKERRYVAYQLFLEFQKNQRENQWNVEVLRYSCSHLQKNQSFFKKETYIHLTKLFRKSLKLQESIEIATQVALFSNHFLQNLMKSLKQLISQLRFTFYQNYIQIFSLLAIISKLGCQVALQILKLGLIDVIVNRNNRSYPPNLLQVGINTRERNVRYLYNITENEAFSAVALILIEDESLVKSLGELLQKVDHETCLVILNFFRNVIKWVDISIVYHKLKKCEFIRYVMNVLKRGNSAFSFTLLSFIPQVLRLEQQMQKLFHDRGVSQPYLHIIHQIQSERRLFEQLKNCENQNMIEKVAMIEVICYLSCQL